MTLFAIPTLRRDVFPLQIFDRSAIFCSIMTSDPRRRRCSVAVRHRDILKRPRSKIWYLIHDINYIMGGMCFVPASCMYFAQVSQNPLALTAGGWLFTIGSFSLVMADLQEWWYYRVGCIFDCKYRGALQSSKHILEEGRCPALQRRFDRAKIGINIFTSVCGSALYLAGSILLIPGFEAYLVLSIALIIAGSSVIFLSQLAKVYRSGHIDDDDDDQLGGQFRFSNLAKNITTVSADSSAAIGAIFFLIGSVVFLPQLNIDQIYQDLGSALFACGGVGFAISGLFLLHEDFCRNREITL